MVTLLIALFSMTLVFISSPLKMCLSLTISSVVMSMMAYLCLNSLYIPSIMTISFSSGMMVSFSYCAMMCYQEKTKKKNFLFTAMLLCILLLVMIPQNSMINSTLHCMKMMNFNNFNFPSMTIMMVVMITMLSINKTIFSTSKKMMESY